MDNANQSPSSVTPSQPAPATAPRPIRTPEEQRRYEREQADLRLLYGSMSRAGRRRFSR